MNFIVRLVVVTVTLAFPYSVSADSAWTKPPTNSPVAPTDSPTFKPTANPTANPTPVPTPVPTTKAPIYTGGPTYIPPPACGTIKTSDGSDRILGPYSEPSSTRGKSTFDCNINTGHSYSQRFAYPEYKYQVKVDGRCRYQFRTPEGNKMYEEVRDVNSWIEQAAMLMQREDHIGYRHSDDDIIFSGLSVPNYDTDVITEDINGCPENFCVKIIGDSLTRKSLGSDYPTASNPYTEEDLELVYAFSSEYGWKDFYKMWQRILSQSQKNKEQIFLTNHFLRCGCESFCMDETNPYDNVHVQATCYVEELCGVRVFQIAYTDDYPENQKAAWASTGTTRIMDWFDECALAMYGCTKTEGSDISTFVGTYWDRGRRYKGYPLKFNEDTRNGAENVYGLGGSKYHGFPDADTSSTPQISWTCPTEDHRNELRNFGDFIEVTEYMRDSGLDISVPAVPCESEILHLPEPADNPSPIGPSCDDIDIDHVFCLQMPGATCYAITTDALCNNVEFVMVNETSTTTYDDVAVWNDDCLASGVSCTRYPGWDENMDGSLTYKGFPVGSPHYTGTGWQLLLLNKKNEGKNTIEGNNGLIYYDCGDRWQNAYGGANFTLGADGRYSMWDNSYGDLYKRQECTSEPSKAPSESPTVTVEPSDMPSLSPTTCTESYLTSENLNIALAVDLSFSTYQKIFSSTVDVGDFNNDGKGNTILDAQVTAIQELLIAISESQFLNNSNCEINLVSFSTDATDHGVWKPLSDSNDDFNPDLMSYIKSQLRAPTSSLDVFQTNNGFTNFDAALDVTVEYFENVASPDRKNLLVFLSDGEPNVRGDGDAEGYCSETTTFWNGDNTVLQCADLGLNPGERHDFCRSDSTCAETEAYQDCVRGPNECMNSEAATQYDSEISALTRLNVERLAIGIGNESNVAMYSALWIIDNNPAKYLGVLPLQALNVEDLKNYVSSLCILNTDPPTGSPSASPTHYPTKSPAPSANPSTAPSMKPSDPPQDNIFGIDSNSAGDSITNVLYPFDGNGNRGGNCAAPGSGSGDSFGLMKMCVRTSFGYTKNSIFQEVNFIETLIKIKYDLTAGFCVDAFAVDPKERVETTNVKDYGLEAWLCAPGDTEDLTDPVRTLPKKIASYAPDSVTGEKQEDGDAFTQGSLVTVCVAPDDPTYEDNIVISALTSFDWYRDDPSVIQPAIEQSAPASDLLTSYKEDDCDGAEWCTFSTLLFADFYVSPGAVYGLGNANLEFRKLGGVVDEERRQLQEDVAASPFEVIVALESTDETAGDETSAGVSYGYSVSASALALASAALLA